MIRQWLPITILLVVAFIIFIFTDPLFAMVEKDPPEKDVLRELQTEIREQSPNDLVSQKLTSMADDNMIDNIIVDSKLSHTFSQQDNEDVQNLKDETLEPGNESLLDDEENSDKEDYDKELLNDDGEVVQIERQDDIETNDILNGTKDDEETAAVTDQVEQDTKENMAEDKSFNDENNPSKNIYDAQIKETKKNIETTSYIDNNELHSVQDEHVIEQTNFADESFVGESKTITGKTKDLMTNTEDEGVTSDYFVPFNQGVLEASLLDNVSLEATHVIDNNAHQIKLQLSGKALLDLSLLGSMYVIFQLPEEIMSVIQEDTLQVDYDVPGVSVLIPIIRNRGTYTGEDIIISGNQIYVNFTDIIGLNLLSIEDYFFTLTFHIDYLPPSSNDTYHFYGQTTNQLIELSLIDLNDLGHAILAAPEGDLAFKFIPGTLEFETTAIPNQQTVVQREEANWSLIVEDLRHDKAKWQVLARAGPLKLTENPVYELSDALIYVNDENEEHIISEESIIVFQYDEHMTDEILVSWPASEGILLSVDPAEVIAGNYETTITWTLVDAP